MVLIVVLKLMTTRNMVQRYQCLERKCCLFREVRRRGLLCSGILRGVVWELFTDVSRQRIGSVFNGQESFLLGLLAHEDGTGTLSGNVGIQLPHDAV
jgi:hypothetical protein